MNPILKKILPHAVAVLAFATIAAIYFYPQLEGKVIRQGDLIQYYGMSAEVNKFASQNNETSLWTNSMFGGMPTFQINSISEGNQLSTLDRFLRLRFGAPAGMFIAGMIGFYILLVSLGASPWLAMIGGIGFAFSTNNFVLYEAGHVTKLNTIFYLPYVAAGMILVYQKRYLWGAALFSLGTGAALLANHPQMLYYFVITTLIFVVAKLVHDIRNQQLMDFVKSNAILVLCSAMALASAANNVFVTFEYSQDTMRGKPVLEPVANTDGGNASSSSSSETDGLAWDYAMQWSNNTLDLVASFIPGVVGGGSNETVDQGSALNRDPNWRQVVQMQGNSAPLYWGALPFTSGPIYFGAGLVFLFILGLFLIEGPVKWWLGLGTLLTLLLSLGKNLEWFNELFFYYFPLYNKFRTPNSVLSVTALLVSLLAFMTLSGIFQRKFQSAAITRSLYIAGGISAAVCLFFIVIGPSAFDFSGASDGRYAQAGLNLNPLIEARKELMRGDALRSLAIVLLIGGIIWAWVNQKLSYALSLAGIGAIVVFDMWTVGQRYLGADKFVSPQIGNAVTTQPNAADQQIMQDPDIHYRVLDQTESPFQSARASNFHKSVGGYHAAKLQRYQDLIDYQIGKGNQRVLDMLNTKYFIVNDGSGPAARINPGALGNAWFVQNINFVNSNRDELNLLSNINPAEDVVIHKEFNDYIGNLTPEPNGEIRLLEYKPNRLTYAVKTGSEQLAVFSEIWYGPKKGWQAYLDGEPVDHIRANYVLRAMKVPAGDHTIEFVFAPKTYQIGTLLTRIFSNVILLGFFGYAGYSGWQYFRNMPVETPETPKSPAASTKTAAVVSNRKNKKK